MVCDKKPDEYGRNIDRVNKKLYTDYKYYKVIIHIELGCMTVVKEELKEALEQLKGTGVRITPQRHAVLEYLVESMAHPTADEIYKALEGKFPNMSVATVYNNLRVFKEVGLVKRTHLRRCFQPF
ncbi:hypothetical protein GCM10020331_088800 [Ectobacillus funiculus]